MNTVKFGVGALFAFCLIPLTLSSCAKSQNDSKIYIDTESMRTMAGDGMKLVHVVVNVRGPNMPLVNLVWDAKDGDGVELESAPDFFEITVPSGPDRLIQYLGVYENDDNLMQFYYADERKSFGPGDVAVNLVANPFGSATRETLVKGRFLRENGTAPTGRVEWMMAPPGSKPPMLIDEEFIYGGWFEFMLFDGVPITYRMKDTGEVLFPGPIPSQLDSILAGPNYARMVKLTFPEYFHGYPDGDPESNDTVCSSSERSPESTYYFGFFGPGAEVEGLYQVGVGTSDYLYGNTGSGYSGLFTTCVDGLVPDPVSNYVLPWNDPNDGVGILGGKSMPCESQPFCISAADFRQGPHQAYSSGPFRILPHSYSIEYYRDGGLTFQTPAGGPISSIEWSLLPGAERDLKEFEVYTRFGSGSHYSGRDFDTGLRLLGCSAFLKDQGFALHSKIPKINSPVPQIEYDIKQGMNSFIGKDVAICPIFRVGNKDVPGRHIAASFSSPTPIVEGLPTAYWENKYHTNHQTLSSVTVTGVQYFQYKFGWVDCGENVDWVSGTLGGNLNLTMPDENEDYSLCVRGKNTPQGEWYHAPAHNIRYDTLPPQYANDFTCITGSDYQIQLVYNEPLDELSSPQIFASSGGAISGISISSSFSPPKGYINLSLSKVPAVSFWGSFSLNINGLRDKVGNPMPGSIELTGAVNCP